MTLPNIDNFLTNYGGPLVNYAPVEDPSTDRDASATNQWYVGVAAMTQTCLRAIAVMGTANVGGVSVPYQLLQDWAVWANGSGVNLFGNRPAIVRVSAGVYTFTWPATLPDPLGVTQTLALGFASAAIQGGALGFQNAVVTAPNVVTVRLWDTTFAASDIGNPSVLIFVG